MKFDLIRAGLLGNALVISTVYKTIIENLHVSLKVIKKIGF